MEHTLSKAQSQWLQDNGYFEPQYIVGSGWYSFKVGDVIPTYIQPYFIELVNNRQRLHPRVNLTEENKLY